MAAGESHQPSDETAGDARRPLGGCDLTRYLLKRSRIGWIRVHSGGDIADPQALGDRETQLTAHLSRAAGHDRRSNQNASTIRDQFDESLFIVITFRAIHAREIPPRDGH